MKKKKAIVKESRKLAKKELTAQIVAALSTVTVNASGNQKKLDKVIAKSAKQLAKKFSSYITATEKPVDATPVAPVKKSVSKKSAAKKEEVPA
ncbi:hypothetical protein EZ428_12645 [Pedobacter frigiditerrae]|uniref:Uncharacterized protein n=1 Tax=Pedobacter frigiditerrae TaxID=2530452 RepID=A0A4R0MSX7_9SPHI|nr:hypothetical protein [Pedobacter frigiditerrae]TCC90131.1 hypothetical protein EZ428_12645 [Pedobacter frigiditerrae]